jgi:lipopolysaccharide export system protein LptA
LLFAAAFAVSGAPDADPLPVGASREPLEMSAEHLDLDVEAKTALLTGGVKLTKGPLTIACPRVEVRYDQVPHVTWAKGSGGVVAEVKGVRAEAPEVELDLPGQAIALRGGVRLTRGEGWITADQATIQIATGKVSMTGVKGSIPVGALPGTRPSP